jgi:hypothetical protein
VGVYLLHGHGERSLVKVGFAAGPLLGKSKHVVEMSLERMRTHNSAFRVVILVTSSPDTNAEVLSCKVSD